MVAGLFAGRSRYPLEQAMAVVKELEAGLYARGCSCPGSEPRWDTCFADWPALPDDGRCTCAAGGAALSAMEACVAAGTAALATQGGGTGNNTTSRDL